MNRELYFLPVCKLIRWLRAPTLEYLAVLA